MKRTLRRIAPVKFGMIVGIIYGLLSLVFVPFFLLFLVAGGVAALMQNSPQTGVGPIVGVVLSLVFCLALPILYGAMGCLMGMLMAWLYNVVAGWIGGIEFDVE